jgi:hypothetical protein
MPVPIFGALHDGAEYLEKNLDEPNARQKREVKVDAFQLQAKMTTRAIEALNADAWLFAGREFAARPATTAWRGSARATYFKSRGARGVADAPAAIVGHPGITRDGCWD